ncbi:MAG: S46 family peptidase [Acidobacteriota bacterium]
MTARIGPTLLICTMVSISILLASSVASGDEGMWTFDNPPRALLKERHGFEPSQEWLDHLRLASVRIGDGASGSFVSPDGLVLTNHHVGRGQLQKVSTPEKDYVKDGFHARKREEELKCPDIELNVLISMEDVTARVQGVVKPGMTEEDALDARNAEKAKIEKESLAGTGLRSDVIALYHGGEYWLYRYKKYTDVRLVFAPEMQIAFYGGDPDNFTYPRYDLDITVFRVYENGVPIQSPAFLRWNANGAADGELVFVSGHPGSTDRLLTVKQLEFERDYTYPVRLKDWRRQLDAVKRFATQGPEQARRASAQLYSLSNRIKSRDGEHAGLLDPRLMAQKMKEETELRKLIAGHEQWQSDYGDAWDAVAAAEEKAAEKYSAYYFRRIGGYRLPAIALNIVRYVVEVKKPDGARLKEFYDSRLDSLRFKMFSPAPVYLDFEEALAADSLAQSLEALGADDPFVKAALAGRAPAEVAHEVIGGTGLADPAVRQRLVKGGEKAVRASEDPLIRFALRVDPILREMNTWQEQNVESALTSAAEKIGKARFAVGGRTIYPDATSTLRLSPGVVKGFPMNGTKAPSKTTLFGLYDRAASFDYRPPFDLPEGWLNGRDQLDLSTPMNFVCTSDIIGGNSGSPVVNTAGEIVGVVFDGNIESLPGRFIFDETANRCVSVHTAAIIESLRKIYGAGDLAEEMEGRR